MEIKPYVKTEWEDEIVDIEPDENGEEIILQDGTRFTASRANNIEEGIANMYGYFNYVLEQLKDMNVRLDTLGRVPINNGSFYDPIGSNGEARNMTMLKELAVVQTSVLVGATEITLDNASVFKVGDNITIFDDMNEEIKTISNVVGNKITVSAITNTYKKGAFVVRTNSVIKDNKLTYGTWGTFKVNVKEVI